MKFICFECYRPNVIAHDSQQETLIGVVGVFLVYPLSEKFWKYPLKILGKLRNLG